MKDLKYEPGILPKRPRGVMGAIHILAGVQEFDEAESFAQRQVEYHEECTALYLEEIRKIEAARRGGKPID